MTAPRMRTLTLVALVLGAVSLGAQERERSGKARWEDDYGFGASVQVARPEGDFKTRLGERAWIGIGAQWTGFHEDWWLSRTRFEWNVLPETQPTGAQGTRTYMKTLNLSFDQLVFFAGEPVGPYLIGGLGALRTFATETHTTPLPGSPRESRWHMTKLAVTGGIGLRLANQVSVEGRYVVTSLNKSMDANTAQLSVSWYF